MPNDRAAVAREVLTDFADECEAQGRLGMSDEARAYRDLTYPAPLERVSATLGFATVATWEVDAIHFTHPAGKDAWIKRVDIPRLVELDAMADDMGLKRAERLPAPPAPETVTVGGLTWTQGDDGWWDRQLGQTRYAYSPRCEMGKLLHRIASDARVLAEREARIADLERQLNASQKAYYDVADAVAASSTGPDDLARIARETRYERDKLRTELALEEAKRVPMPPMVPDPSVPPNEIHFTQGGKLVGKIVDVAPAPIPLGAVVEDGEGVKWVYGEWRNDPVAWRLLDSDYTRATDWRAANLTALYHARHPVATRETVEAVKATLFESSFLDSRGDVAESILRALGFTLEGA